MIKYFQTLEELFNEIETDKHDYSPSAARYPLRFIFLNSFASLRAIVSHLSSLPVTLQLKTLLLHDDGWLTSDDICRRVKTLDTDSIIVPLSEVLRFFPDTEFQVLFTTLAEIENSPTVTSKRIYIPLVGLKGRFENCFLKTFHRKEQWAPIWSVNDPIQQRIYIFQLISYTGFDACVAPKGFTTLHTTSDWLDLWKHENLRAIVCKSKAMAYLYQHFLPDAIFYPEKIESQKAYLADILGVKLPIEYTSADALFWDSLIQKESQHEHGVSFLDFDHVINYHFNIHNVRIISKEGLVKIWFQHSEAYSRWLLKNWILHQEHLHGSYLQTVMAEIVVYSDEEFISQIWLNIFDDTLSSDDVFDERKAYLKLIHHDYKLPFHYLEEKIQDTLSSIVEKPLNIQVKYLTSISYAERKYLLEMWSTHFDEEQEMLLKVLKTVYPELFFYVQWHVTLQHDTLEDWLPLYFQEYNRSKALNRKSEKLAKIINEKNKDAQSFYNWYYNLNSPQIIENASVIWVDGIGAEWFPLLQYFINTYGKDKNKYVETACLTKANLPTITACNRFDKAIHIMEFDNYIHHEKPYTYPDDLIKQIDLLKAIVKQHIIEHPGEKILVVSDHGFTVLTQKNFGNYKKYDFQAAHHEGRYMWTEEAYQSDSELLLHKLESGNHEGKQALVALKHTSLYKTPYREVHGGATPEEIIVPYIVVSKIDDRLTYHVTLLTPEVSVRNPLVNFAIEPKPSITPLLIWKGKEIQLEQREDTWRVNLQGFKAGDYQFKVHILDQKFDIALTIKGGFKERDLL